MKTTAKKKNFSVIAAAVCAGILVSGCKGKETAPLQEADIKAAAEETEENDTDTGEGQEADQEKEIGPEADTVFVYVWGAVVSPGYELDSGARVYEALEAAGGIKEEAAQEILKPGRKDRGRRAYLCAHKKKKLQRACLKMRRDSDGVVEGTAGSDNSEQGKINMNTAGLEELKTLSGIGDAKAQSIIRYREENGEFQTIEEVMNVEGIKEGVFNKIKDKITV